MRPRPKGATASSRARPERLQTSFETKKNARSADRAFFISSNQADREARGALALT